MNKHKNLQKRNLQKYQAHFVTLVTYKRYPYFKSSILCDLFIRELEQCKKILGFKLFAFCILKDHVHLLLTPTREFDTYKITYLLKHSFFNVANNISRERENSINYYGIQNGSSMHFQQEILSNGLVLNRPFASQFKWQESFHDHIIRSDQDFSNYRKYTTHNFLKHHLGGYAINYKYTSLNYHEMLSEVRR